MCIRDSRILRDFRHFLESVTFGGTLEEVANLASRRELNAWQSGSGGGDLGRFLRIADDLDLWHLGGATDRFMSYGCYDEPAGRPVSYTHLDVYKRQVYTHIFWFCINRNP